MNSKFDHFWQDIGSAGRLRRAIFLSVIAHALIAYGVSATYSKGYVMPPAYQVRFIPYPKGEPQKQENTAEPETQQAEPAKADKPKAEEPKAKVEEPKPKPEEPKPKPEEPKPKPKPDKPKPAKPKPEAKADAKSNTKMAAKPVPRPSPKSAREGTPGSKAGDPKGNDAYMNEPGVMKPGINMPEGTPTVLDGWARLVQIKVEKYWQIPPGLRLTATENKAVVSFWVDRQGNLIGKPEVVQPSSDPDLDESGIKAIQLAVPLPPLPQEFPALEQEVIYVFTLAE